MYIQNKFGYTYIQNRGWLYIHLEQMVVICTFRTGVCDTHIQNKLGSTYIQNRCLLYVAEVGYTYIQNRGCFYAYVHSKKAWLYADLEQVLGIRTFRTEVCDTYIQNKLGSTYIQNRCWLYVTEVGYTYIQNRGCFYAYLEQELAIRTFKIDLAIRRFRTGVGYTYIQNRSWLYTH